MIRNWKTEILSFLVVADLACFIRGGYAHGSDWQLAGVIGLTLCLLLFEVL